MHLVVDPTGRVRAIYSEEMDLATLGQIVIRRASHVEPGCDGRWSADLRPVGGRVPEVPVCEEDCAERTGIRDDEQPHHQLAGWNGKRALFHDSSVVSNAVHLHGSHRDISLTHACLLTIAYSFSHRMNSRYTHNTPMKCQ